MSPVTGQRAVQFKQSMLDPQEAAQIRRVERHDHGEMIDLTQWKKRLNEDVLV